MVVAAPLSLSGCGHRSLFSLAAVMTCKWKGSAWECIGEDVMNMVWGNGLLRKTEAAIGNRDNEIGSENTISRGLHGPRVFEMDVTVSFCLGLSDGAGGVGCVPFFFFSLGSLSLFFMLVAPRMLT